MRTLPRRQVTDGRRTPQADPSLRWRTEASIQRGRIAALAMATAVTLSLRGLSADPRWAIVAVLLITVVSVQVALAGARHDRLLPVVGWGSFAGDGLAIAIALAVVSTNPADPIWAISALLAIEAAVRWRTRGAVAGGLLAAVLAGGWAVAAYGYEGRALSIESLLFRGTVIVVLALPVGLLIDQLRREQERSRQLEELSTELILLVDPDGTIMDANPAAVRLLGVAREELCGRPVSQVLPGSPPLDELLAASGAGDHLLYELPRQGDGGTSLELSADHPGEQDLLHVIGRDVTARIRAEQQLRASEQRFRALFERHVDAVLGLDADGSLLHANPAAARLLGAPASRLIGRPLLDVVPSSHHDELRAALRSALDGRPREDAMVLRLGHDPPRDVSLVLLPAVVDGEVTGVFVLARDVTEERVREEELRFQAEHDALTGLPNRVALRERMNAALDAGRPFGVLFADLDGLKHLNDTHGHAAGDAALVAVAERLRRAVRESDAAFRLAGDEFCVLVDPVDEVALGALRDRVSSVIGQPLAIGEHLIPMSASVGLALSRPEDDADALLARADEAMYAIKVTRPGRRRPASEGRVRG